MWPLDAFWRATAWFLFLLCCVAVFLFAVVSDEWTKDQWRISDRTSWLNHNLPWILVLLVGAVLATLLAMLTRRGRSSPVRFVESSATRR